MNDVMRRNHYDVTDRVFVADPRLVCAEVCALLRGVAATHFGGRNRYLEVIDGHVRRLREPLKVILGMQPAEASGIRVAARTSGYKRRKPSGAVDPGNYVPT